MDGIVNIEKEAGMTSFDVVWHCRHIFDTKKIGHTGTLDPMAVGVLPVCVGKATRLCEYLTAQDKVYTTVLKLGLTTDTQDVTGTVLTRAEHLPAAAEVRAALQGFLGEGTQLPPMYSAIKIKGQKLVDLARRGIEVEREPRPIAIYRIDLLEQNEQAGEYRLRIHCKKGTYIRTLCHDIGQRLGVGGVMKTLERNRSGAFDDTTAVKLDELRQAKERGELERYLLPLDAPFAGMERMTADAVQERLICNGVELMLSRTPLEQAPGRALVYGADGSLLLLAEKCPGEDSLKRLKGFY